MQKNIIITQFYAFALQIPSIAMRFAIHCLNREVSRTEPSKTRNIVHTNHFLLLAPFRLSWSGLLYLDSKPSLLGSRHRTRSRDHRLPSRYRIKDLSPLLPSINKRSHDDVPPMVYQQSKTVNISNLSH